MRSARLLRRRVGAHPVAVAATAATVLASVAVVTVLQLLTAQISTSGVRSTLDVPAKDRSVVVSAGLRPGSLAPVDAAVRRSLAGLRQSSVTRVATTTTRGLPGRLATDRALLADVDGTQAASDLVSGRWPRASSDDGRPAGVPVEVALPETAARALGLAVGDRLVVSDVVDEDAPGATLVVTGLFRPRSPEDALWVDLPLGLVGVSASDFTTYGPFVVPPGAFDGSLVGASTVTWRAAVDLTTTDAAALPALSRSVDETVRDLRRTVGLPVEPGAADSARPTDLPVSSPRVLSDLPGLVRSAQVVERRITVSTLAPTLLVGLMGAVALVGTSALLASLRSRDTRLLGLRGGSAARLAALALADAVALTLLGVGGTVLVAPVAARALAPGVPAASSPSGLPDPMLWRVLIPLTVLTVLVVTVTTSWVGAGASTHRRGGRDAGGGLRVLAGAGADLTLVGLGVVAAVQLRRYAATGSTSLDPVTAAAPALVVAGLAVLCLRLLPRAARALAAWAANRRGLGAAWAGWQLGGRIALQTVTVLLVVLATSLGTIALGHSATTQRAFEDQSALESGAALRVVRGVGEGAGDTESLVRRIVGDDEVMPVWRGSAGLGALGTVTVLAADTAVAGRVMDVRPDTVAAGVWPAVVGRLAAARDVGAGAALPVGGRRLEVTARTTLPRPATEGYAAVAHLRDARGVVRDVPLGAVRGTDTRLVADLTEVEGPATLVGIAVPLPDIVRFGADADDVTALSVSRVAVDGAEVAGTEGFSDDSTLQGLWWDAAPTAAGPVAAVVTPDVEAALRSSGSGAVSLALGPREVPIRVVGVVDVLPTADVPGKGVLLDLPSLGAAPVSVDGVEERSRAVIEPDEWWANPRDPGAAAAALAAGSAYGTTVVQRAELVASRRADPVNSGLMSAMLLVASASALLAAVGVAAGTAALAGARRQENAVLHALGMPPSRIRSVLLLERALVVSVTVLLGVGVGAVAAVAVVPFLVGGDGHPQAPPVRVVLPLGLLAAYATALAAALWGVTAAVLGRAPRGSVEQLRGGWST
ncbi:FtsX-like permease family protein [Phycicoccus avicenniae]|uniref:FtsX-like permease family protein n=1 Tax=Phycicoccus avicenniae TaxID=2828860 RepID=UPI003D2DF877